jgi:3-phenylpropionate/trans-cinnamate dioxygenase ferredoxin reductase subunit
MWGGRHPSQDQQLTIVIVGGGMACGNAAATLREEGFDGPLIIMGNEAGVPFGRPPLSKQYLRGEDDLSEWIVRPPEWYVANRVELRHDSPVAGVDPGARAVVTRSGERVSYDQLLIATGGRNRVLPIPGAELDGVFQLRTQLDCDRIRAAARRGDRVVLVGMGFIGSEVAASLTQLGVQVMAVFPGSAPLAGVLGEEVASVLARIHREKGVELLAGQAIASLEGGSRVEAITTTSGLRLECSTVIVAVGIQPNVEFLEGSGIAIENGVLVDELCRTSLPGVFACGDVANMAHPLFGRLRVEHFNNAEKHGRAAARSMLGSASIYDYNFSFWSDQYEHSIEYVGSAHQWDRLVFRGNLEEARILGFYVRDGRLRATVGLNRGGDPEAEPDSELAACAKLIARGDPVPTEALADEGTDLWDLVRVTG